MGKCESFIPSRGGVLIFNLRASWLSVSDACSVVQQYGVSYA